MYTSVYVEQLVVSTWLVWITIAWVTASCKSYISCNNWLILQINSFLYEYMDMDEISMETFIILVQIGIIGVLASEGWWEAWQPSPKVTRSY